MLSFDTLIAARDAVRNRDISAVELTRQALGYRMLQLLALPLASLDKAQLQRELQAIARS